MSIWKTEASSIKNTWTPTGKMSATFSSLLLKEPVSKMGRFLLVACHSHHNQTPPVAVTSFLSEDADWSGRILIRRKGSF